MTANMAELDLLSMFIAFLHAQPYNYKGQWAQKIIQDTHADVLSLSPELGMLTLCLCPPHLKSQECNRFPELQSKKVFKYNY